MKTISFINSNDAINFCESIHTSARYIYLYGPGCYSKNCILWTVEYIVK